MRKLSILLTLALFLAGCGAAESGQAGLVTEEVTTDPNATRIVSPLFVEDTDASSGDPAAEA